MKSDRTRIIITVMKGERGDAWHFVASYNPGAGLPRLSAEGDAPTKPLAIDKGFEEAGRLFAQQEGAR